MKNEIKEGNILVSEWGWEQTNVSFYKVLKVTPKSFKLVKLGKSTVYDNQCMTGVNLPLIDEEVDKPFIRRSQNKYTTGRQTVNISDYESAWLWNGKEVGSTHYA